MSVSSVLRKGNFKKYITSKIRNAILHEGAAVLEGYTYYYGTDWPLCAAMARECSTLEINALMFFSFSPLTAGDAAVLS